MPKPRRHRISIGGKRWLLELGAKLPSDRWGDCTNPNNRNRRIRIGNARGIGWLDVLLHELIHARWWALCESEVNEFASELSAVLLLLREQVLEAMEEDEDLGTSSWRRSRSSRPGGRSRGSRSCRKTSSRSCSRSAPSSRPGGSPAPRGRCRSRSRVKLARSSHTR